VKKLIIVLLGVLAFFAAKSLPRYMGDYITKHEQEKNVANTAEFNRAITAIVDADKLARTHSENFLNDNFSSSAAIDDITKIRRMIYGIDAEQFPRLPKFHHIALHSLQVSHEMIRIRLDGYMVIGRVKHHKISPQQAKLDAAELAREADEKLAEGMGILKELCNYIESPERSLIGIDQIREQNRQACAQNE
jgi:hypothetical protein